MLSRFKSKTGVRFIKFCIVGGTGFLIQAGLTYSLTEFAHLWYMASLVISLVVTTITNFTLNSVWTFKNE